MVAHNWYGLSYLIQLKLQSEYADIQNVWLHETQVDCASRVPSAHKRHVCGGFMGLCLHKASVSQVIHAGGLQNTRLCK